jgi:hypothetical protein
MNLENAFALQKRDVSLFTLAAGFFLLIIIAESFREIVNLLVKVHSLRSIGRGRVSESAHLFHVHRRGSYQLRFT